MRPLMIIFEGVDKSGKTSLLNLVNKKTDFRYWILDRSFISSFVYNDMFNREELDDYYFEVQEAMKSAFNILIIYIHANTNLIKKRLQEHNEILPEELSNIDTVKNSYKHHIKMSHINYIEINTTYESLEQCSNKIINEIKKIEGGNN